MGSTYKILVVDDDPDSASALSELFEFEGHSVTTVSSGDAAIAQYLTQDFDIAFMDVMMPGKNGVESFLEIRRLKPAARVVMMTGFSVEQLLQQALENGAMGVLSKPMEPSRVLSMLDELGAKSVVVAVTSETNNGEVMHRILADAGRVCQLVREPRGVITANEPDAVIIFDTHRPLIESVGYYKQMRAHGHLGPAIIMVQPADADTSAGMLQDFTVTGVLNKPFDPVVLLEKLSVVAA